MNNQQTTSPLQNRPRCYAKSPIASSQLVYMADSLSQHIEVGGQLCDWPAQHYLPQTGVTKFTAIHVDDVIIVVEIT